MDPEKYVEEFNHLMEQMWGDTKPEHEQMVVTFRQIFHNGRLYYRAEDVAEAMETLGQYRTARHIREHLQP